MVPPAAGTVAQDAQSPEATPRAPKTDENSVMVSFRYLPFQ
jgi:hypothetical protein